MSLTATQFPAPGTEAGSAIPRVGGDLVFNSYGVATCMLCNWRGVPTIVDGVASDECPSCQAEDLDEVKAEVISIEERRQSLPKVGRNAPCPCGSGLKYKKCCGGR